MRSGMFINAGGKVLGISPHIPIKGERDPPDQDFNITDRCCAHGWIANLMPQSLLFSKEKLLKPHIIKGL